jgi:hypothetical protein
MRLFRRVAVSSQARHGRVMLVLSNQQVTPAAASDIFSEHG